ncbi:MAG: polysaccharide deacetylase family protein [Gammaproteobacteria bacterium]|nr:polysaccharide deacetylase family protein [Gammaproteobacteria bacterium]
MNLISRIFFVFLVVSIAACSSAPRPKLSAFEERIDSSARKEVNATTFAKNDEFVVLITQQGDTLENLSEKYLGDKNKSWIIADFNDIDDVVPHRELVIPLKSQNHTGIYINGYQTIPILCYHRFGPGHEKMIVSGKNFRQQMQYLKDNGYHVIAMKDVYDFVDGTGSLPKKSVVITIDDGYRSTYEIAYPILKEFGYPATVFLYTDFMGARDALNWTQNKEMLASGLIDLQPHSKSHPNMSLAKIGESPEDYWKRIKKEIDNPSAKIKRFLKNPLHTFAYPYGDTNEQIISYLKKKKFLLGVTVQPGGNPTFAHPYMLHRTMIFGDHDLNDFKKALVTFKEVDLK